jgi:hypothetical protein
MFHVDSVQKWGIGIDNPHKEVNDRPYESLITCPYRLVSDNMRGRLRNLPRTSPSAHVAAMKVG